MIACRAYCTLCGIVCIVPVDPVCVECAPICAACAPGAGALFEAAVATALADYALCKYCCDNPSSLFCKVTCAVFPWVCPKPPKDPNELEGPPGYSIAGYVGNQKPWKYTAFFENTSNALAFARQIVITNALDPSF